MPIHNWTRVPTGIFHDFHQDWAVRLKLALNDGVLPPGYYALIEQSSGGRHPDVLKFQTEHREPASTNGGGAASRATGNVLTLAETPPRASITATIESDIYVQKSNRIVVFGDGDEVVAVLEIVSPGNKSSRYRFEMFVEKALQFIQAGIHLLFVDLFPPTSRDPNGLHAAIWSRMAEYELELPSDKPLTVASYLCGDSKTAFAEAVGVGDELPDMPLFLESDRYVQVPLEATYRIAFDDLPRRWRDVLATRASKE